MTEIADLGNSTSNQIANPADGCIKTGVDHRLQNFIRFLRHERIVEAARLEDSNSTGQHHAALNTRVARRPIVGDNGPAARLSADNTRCFPSSQKLQQFPVIVALRRRDWARCAKLAICNGFFNAV